MAGIDRSYYQVEGNRPTPELANHRTPIKNLYATGGCWHLGSNAGSSESYNCYKIIAKDLNLAKPWEESDKKEPDSLVDEASQGQEEGSGFGQAQEVRVALGAGPVRNRNPRWRRQTNLPPLACSPDRQPAVPAPSLCSALWAA